MGNCFKWLTVQVHITPAANRCNMPQHAATHNKTCSLEWPVVEVHSATHCKTLQHTATHVNTQQCTTTHSSTFSLTADMLKFPQPFATYTCFVVQILFFFFLVSGNYSHVAVHCSTLHCVAVCGGVLQCNARSNHPVPHLNTPKRERAKEGGRERERKRTRGCCSVLQSVGWHAKS